MNLNDFFFNPQNTFFDLKGPKVKHYANTPMQYTAIFHGCKIVNFQMNFSNIFLTFAQNINCEYTLEPPHEAVLTSAHILSFMTKIRKKCIPL